MGEWVNEWMNGWMDEWVKELVIRLKGGGELMDGRQVEDEAVLA